MDYKEAYLKNIPALKQEIKDYIIKNLDSIINKTDFSSAYLDEDEYLNAITDLGSNISKDVDKFLTKRILKAKAQRSPFPKEY